MALDRGAAPLPPAGLSERQIPLVVLPPARWYRVHRAVREPCFYSESPAQRFSSPGLGVLYLADSPVTAFWETFWDELATRPPGERRIARAKLDARAVREVLPSRSFRVFDALDARSLRTVSAPAGTFLADYATCQAWARALAAHPSSPDGILYPSSRSAGARCLALFAARTGGESLAFGSATPVGAHVTIMAELLGSGVSVLDD